MSLLIWASFIIFILFLLLLDLGLLHKKGEIVTYKSALMWSVFWIFLALLFGAVIFVLYSDPQYTSTELLHPSSPNTALLHYYTGYLIEKSLSLDNIFVIVLIFQFYKIPLEHQHKVLFLGIAGAIIMRGIMIFLGVSLMHSFEWLIYVFGLFLVFTSIKIYITREKEKSPGDNFFVKLFSKYLPYTNKVDSGKFFVKINKIRYATPLVPALIVIETSDVIFAIDSIPAIFSITLDPFIIFTSNIFAILGLRSLYFVLAAMIEKFAYLKMSLVFILLFVGIKMVIIDFIHIPAWISLIVILIILLMGILPSIGKK